MIKSKRLRWAGHIARMQEDRSAFKILTGTPTGNRPLERPRCRWEDDIRMDLKEIGNNTRNWIDSAQEREYWKAFCECGIEPPYSISHGVVGVVMKTGRHRGMVLNEYITIVIPTKK